MITRVLGATVADRLFPFEDPIGHTVDCRGAKYVVVGVMAAGQLLLGFSHDERWQVYTGTLLAYGIGLTFAMTAMSSLIVSGVPQGQTGEASGMNTMVRTVGGSVGSQVVTALVVAGGAASSHGFTVAFAVCGALLLIALPLCAAVPSALRR